MADSLRVITFNCWGLKFISKMRHERLSQIGDELGRASPPPQLVALQECRTQHDYEVIREKIKHILPYGKYYYSGVFGSGLAILSKWPILESSMNPYKLNGRPTAFFRGDWYVGKGVASAKIATDSGKVVEVFCTHLHAPYEREPNDSYICHRTAQAWEIAKLMRSAYEKGHLVLGMGDFNMIPLSLAHRIITTHGFVNDIWRLLYPDSSLGAHEDSAERSRGKTMPSADFNIKQNGTTCDSILNTWRWNKGQQQALVRGENLQVDSAGDDPSGKRLDYIFLGDPKSDWKVERVDVGFTSRHPTLHCSLSDHFSVEATLIGRSDDKLVPNAEQMAVGDTPAHKAEYLPQSTYDEILAMTTSYVKREEKQRRWRLWHFGGHLVVSIGCLVAVWWSPKNYVSFLLMLLSTLGLSAGVVDGLIGGLFMSWELRNLKEFKWEIENAKMLAGYAASITSS